jgi:hypothetical protein
MKKIIYILIIIFVINAFISVAFADTTVTCDKAKAHTGDSITITGTSNGNKIITIKIIDQKTNIVYLNTVSVKSSMQYTDNFIVPKDILEGVLTVTAGSDDDVAKTTITIVKNDTPTPTTTPKPTATPNLTPAPTFNPTNKPVVTESHKPTKKPVATASPRPTKKSVITNAPVKEESHTPTKQTPTIVPQRTVEVTPTVTPKPIVSTPTYAPVIGDIDIDPESGIITIVIDVSELPKDIVAIKVPSGKISRVQDAVDGKITLLAVKQNINDNGELQIIMLNEEQVPYGSAQVQVLENNKPSLLKIHLWIILILIAILIFPAIKLVKKLRSL